MPTLAEVLKKSGWTQERIDALDTQVLSAADGYISTVEQTALQASSKAESDRKAAEAAAIEAKSAQEASELANRNVQDFWATTYPTSLSEHNTALQAAEAARINAEAKAAWLQAQVDGAKAAGITLADAPTFTPPKTPDPVNGTRDGQGRFVPGPNGSPVFDTNTVIRNVSDGFNTIANIQWKYQTLYGGQPLPIAPSELIAQADRLKLNPMEYASRTFKFAEKEEEQRQLVARKHDEDVALAERTKADSEWKAKLDAREAEFAAKEKLHAERGGNNPDVRIAVSSKIPELQRRVETKDLPDPLMMNENQRRAQTAKMIRETIAAKEVAA